MKKNGQIPIDGMSQKEPDVSKVLIHTKPRNERYEIGKQQRKVCPRSSHANWKIPAGRHDSVDLIIESNKTGKV